MRQLFYLDVKPLPSGLDSTSVSSTEMLEDAVIVDQHQQPKTLPPERQEVQQQQQQPHRRMSDVERRKSVEVERRKPTDVVLERRKSNQDVCRVNSTVLGATAAGNGEDGRQPELARKTSRSISESIVNAKGE